MLTMAFASQLITDWLGDRSMVKRLEGRFAGMVVPGDELNCSASVASKDEATRRVVINVTVANQRGEKVFTKGVAEAEFPPQRSNRDAA
jgi:acyl dehydratase